MIDLEDRQSLDRDIEEAQETGERLEHACETAGIAAAPEGWPRPCGCDGRPVAVHPTPAHALTLAEREDILRVANKPRFADMPAAHIVPMLADEGIYIAGESSFHRVLRAHGQTRHRGRASAPRPSRPPTTHVATSTRQLWRWDM